MLDLRYGETMDLYKIKSDGKIMEIKKAPFSDEPKELEDFIVKNEGVLGNLVLLNRQITLPDSTRMDIWGLDMLDKRPVIVELKNVLTGIEIIPQILPYHNFVKSNPDTLKFKAASDSRFLNKLKSLELDQEELFKGLEADPKVILIAPIFKKELLDAINYMKIDIELIEISRYRTEENEYQIAINKPQVEAPTQATVRVMEEWNWDKYQKEGISESKINTAKPLEESLRKILADQKIALKPIFRKLYIPFQSGRSNVFWIDLGYTSWETGDVVLTLNLDKEPDMKSEGIQINHTRTRWQKDYSQWSIFFNKPVDLSPLVPIIRRAYEHVTGAKIEQSEHSSSS